MKKRIYGLETEYGIAVITEDGRWICKRDGLSEYTSHFYTSPFYGYNQNGSRIYIEMQFHPEYCTSECVNLSDLVAQDKAGERILRKICAKAVEAVKTEREAKKIIREEAKEISLFKNNVQYGEAESDITRDLITFGCHENFSIEKKLGVESLKKVIVRIATARQIFSGSGWVANKSYQSQGIRYLLSQRARFIGDIVSSETHPSVIFGCNYEFYYHYYGPDIYSEGFGLKRAILCTARLNEPHADAEKYQRLHLILGDSNMSELCTYLKMGTVGILLEMLEEGYLFEELKGITLKYPVRALHLISRDLTGQKPVIELENGKFISAIDLLWVYVSMFHHYERIQGLNPELADVKQKLTDILLRFERRKLNPETLMEEDSQGLNEEIDWLIKKDALEHTLKTYGCHWNNFYEKTIQTENRDVSLYSQLRKKDLRYHDISPNGLYNLRQPELKLTELKELGIRTSRTVEEDLITEMEDKPPQDNRAKLRGDFVRLITEKGLRNKFEIEWSEIKWNFYHQGRLFVGKIFLLDPFATENAELAELSSLIERDEFLQTPPSNPGNQMTEGYYEELLRRGGFII